MGEDQSAQTTTTQPSAVDKTAEIEFWKSVKDSDDPDMFREYLRQFPQGVYAGLAKLKVKKLGGTTTSVAQTSIPDLNYGDYYALVIGNNDYDYLGDLKTAINDAEGIASLLEYEYGFEVDLLKNATRGDIVKALGRFRKTVGPEDNLLIYSAGHGNLDEAANALEKIGLPAIIRPSFTLGGAGGGVAYNKTEYDHIIAMGLAASPVNSVLVEESIIGWKEFEMEVIRDHADNCIIICSIENVDPMGIHTGDSITVAPALTLTDKEYQILRNASIAVLREIGVDTGGSNVQFAINPEDGRLVVIEMNPRVSRSSALASKATGFPIAKIAAKLAVGTGLVATVLGTMLTPKQKRTFIRHG